MCIRDRGISEWHNSENQFIVFRTSDQVNGFCQSWSLQGLIYLRQNPGLTYLVPVSYTHLDVYKRQGLRVVTVSGQPGSEPSITLRGGATITVANNKALIIVDGVVRDSMGDINSSDIESFQVLKDAASTAIYGARANGGGN